MSHPHALKLVAGLHGSLNGLPISSSALAPRVNAMRTGGGSWTSLRLSTGKPVKDMHPRLWVPTRHRNWFTHSSLAGEDFELLMIKARNYPTVVGGTLDAIEER